MRCRSKKRRRGSEKWRRMREKNIRRDRGNWDKRSIGNRGSSEQE